MAIMSLKELNDMRILEILENDGTGPVSHKLCFISANSTGGTSFSGRARNLFLVRPGKREELPPGSAALAASFGELAGNMFLSVGEDALFRVRSDFSPFPLLSVERSGFICLSERASLLRPLSVGILTVSDKGSRGERTDLSGPALADEVRRIGGDVEESRVVPDDQETIAEVLRLWCDRKGLCLILCTGGTGLSRRDVTPEALESVAIKRVPGFGEVMRSVSMASTPMAILSRCCAVTRGQTLIVALPGSVKGAMECFSAIEPALRHGIGILRGWDGECGA